MITTESLADLGVACFPGADLGVEAGLRQGWAGMGMQMACRRHCVTHGIHRRCKGCGTGIMGG